MNDATADAFYDRTAEYVAVLISQAWTGLGPALSRALTGMDPAGPIVDVGAGTGAGTAVIAATVPDVEIIAVEPHPALRTALYARVSGDPELARRVTVVDSDLGSASLPKSISGLIAMNVLGHLSPPEREALWTLLAETLTPQGRAVVTLSAPTTPEVVPPTQMAQVVLGRRRYTGSATAEPAGQDAVTWHMTYRVEEAGNLVTELAASDLWHVLSPAGMARELAPHGLSASAGEADFGLQVISRIRR